LVFIWVFEGCELWGGWAALVEGEVREAAKEGEPGLDHGEAEEEDKDRYADELFSY
jgi:hypothetical protein